MSNKLRPAVSEMDHTQGSQSPQLQIVEYGDFQCPTCGAAEPIIEKIMKEFGEAISLTFRNFPLTNLHQFAFGAAIAAEAAGKQEKYWEMHNLIFANQRSLSDETLLSLAQQIGLDMSTFNADTEDPEITKKVEADFESGARSGVNGTPTFFINGTRFDGGAADMYNLIKENVT